MVLKTLVVLSAIAVAAYFIDKKNLLTGVVGGTNEPDSKYDQAFDGIIEFLQDVFRVNVEHQIGEDMRNTTIDYKSYRINGEDKEYFALCAPIKDADERIQYPLVCYEVTNGDTGVRFFNGDVPREFHKNPFSFPALKERFRSQGYKHRTRQDEDVNGNEVVRIEQDINEKPGGEP